MTDKTFNRLMHGVVEDIRKGTPVDTRNLQKNATKGAPVAHGQFVIEVNGLIASYFRYVNNYRELNGRRNRNYRYFQRALNTALEKIGRVEGDANV